MIPFPISAACRRLTNFPGRRLAVLHKCRSMKDCPHQLVNGQSPSALPCPSTTLEREAWDGVEIGASVPDICGFVSVIRGPLELLELAHRSSSESMKSTAASARRAPREGGGAG